MSTQIIQYTPSREDINALQKKISTLPQPELETEHYFSSAGMYCRKMRLAAGILIVGKVHKEAHFFILASGKMQVWTDQTVTILNSGDVLSSSAGTKRVLFTLTDCIGMNIHKTDKTDLYEIEKELIEDDTSAMYDARNQLKQPVITMERGIPCLAQTK